MKRRHFLLLVGSGAAGLAGYTGYNSLLRAGNAARSRGAFTFRPSGIDGAGFQNVVAVDPFASERVISGADVAGFQRSTNYGDDWIPSNAGVAEVSNGSHAQFRVAAVAFSTITPDKIYAGTGNKGHSGGLFVSTDGGHSWTLRSAVPQFSGTHTPPVDDLPVPHPRSTGNLIALDEANGLIYVGTFDQGVMRSADDGYTWTTLGLEGKYLRSLVGDPDDPDVLYAAAYGDGVWKTTTASGAGTFEKLGGSPPVVEELLVVSGNVYAMAGSDGVFRSRDGGRSWEQLGEGQIATNVGTERLWDGGGRDGTMPTPIWLSIDGYAAPGGPVLFVGCWEGKPNGSLRECVMRSMDGGETWEAITVDPSRIHCEMGGPGGHCWFLEDDAFAQSGYLAAQIVVDPMDTSRVYLPGRAGMWKTENAEAEHPDWYPAVRYMNATINHAILADPNLPGRVYVGNTDRLVFYSTDHLDFISDTSPVEWGDCLSLAADPATTPSRVYAAIEGGGPYPIGIYSNADPASGGDWVSEGLSEATGGSVPMGVTVGRQDGEPIILAAVDGAGVWRKAAGAWAKASSEAMAAEQSTLQASFAWASGSPLVYLYDKETGVWRSKDHGRTWMRIWEKPSPERYTGFVAVEPTRPERLYVSSRDGVYRLENAHTGTWESGTIHPRQVRGGEPGKPGPIAYANGSLYVATQVSVQALPGLLRSRNRGATFEDVSDDFYRATAKFPNAMSVGPDGFVYVALQGLGAVVGVPT